MVFQVAAGMLIAGFVRAIIGFGMNIGFDEDHRILGTHRPGYWMMALGIICAVAVIYFAFA